MENKLNKVQQTVYSDFLIDLDTHPISGDLAVLKNEDSIKRALKNLIFTNLNERFFNPYFGSNINSYLFENFSPTTEIDIRDTITTAVNNFEPRVRIIDIRVVPLIDNNNLSVTIIFNCLNNLENTKLQFVLERVR